VIVTTEIKSNFSKGLTMNHPGHYLSKIISFLILFFISIQVWSQTPQKINYQAVIRNVQQQPVVSSPVKIKLSILRGSVSGQPVYVELHNANTNASGLVSLQIGGGTAVSGSFDKITWGNGDHFLKTEADPTNGNNFSLIGTVQMLSVPYALHAGDVTINKSADTIIIGNLQLLIPGVKSFVNGVPAVIIQGQVWMDRNLEVTKYRNGDPIPEVKDYPAWAGLKTGAWSYFVNDANLGKDYGKLYNWFAVMDPRGLCPTGWRMPSKYDFELLIKNLGGDTVSAVKLMERGTTYWFDNYGNNSSGFSARGGGWRGGDGNYYYWVRDMGNWWTTTKENGNTDWDLNFPWFLTINGRGIPVSRFARDPYFSVNAGVSVRCIKE
jgi:uncharacterized protein (TIGR02145 family)